MLPWRHGSARVQSTYVRHFALISGPFWLLKSWPFWHIFDGFFLVKKKDSLTNRADTLISELNLSFYTISTEFQY